MRPCATGWVDQATGEYRPHVHDPSCTVDHARAGAYWLGMLGFALAGPAASETAARLVRSMGYFAEPMIRRGPR